MFYRRQVCLFKDVCQLYRQLELGEGEGLPMDLLYCSASLIVIDLELVGEGGGIRRVLWSFFLIQIRYLLYTHLTFNQYISI